MSLFPLLFGLLALLSVLSGCAEQATAADGPMSVVEDVAAFNEAVAIAQPGDRIVLANGVWQDAELIFRGKGTAEQPIVLTVEDKGQVTLEGQSYLQLSGEHLVVEGLVFKNGYTPTSEVIAFRSSKEELCNNCRVTECVVDNYNNPERFESDYWVGIYGKNNRFDHNYLTGKSNQGVTLAVRLNTEESRENEHRIDHNYFGYHPILGSNGGETLRIGTSHYSLTNSNTLVEANYFYRCNGEHEIISNKSCQNVFRDNTFYECQGTLTMRHGNETLVENNYFFGNGRANTGGIRIINETQTVRNNYGEGLTGYRFRGALVIMNGVPNSPPNRYFQVIDSEASGNVFYNCDHIQLCAGSDEERSAVPVNTTVSNNVFYHDKRENIFTVYDDISGITFANNLVNPGQKPLQDAGFLQKEITFKEVDGIKIPEGTQAGAAIEQGLSRRATPDNTGVSWYPRNEEQIYLGSGKVIPVAAGTNTLFDALAQSAPGDILELQEAGEYLSTKSLSIAHPISVRAAAAMTEKPVLKFQNTSLFNIDNGGALALNGLHIDGAECRDKPDNAVIRTSRYSMNKNYKLFIENCDFTDLDINHSFNVLRVFQNTFADSVVLRNSTFHNVSGAILPLNQEKDDIGIYNAENVVIENCLFDNVGGAVLHLHRGGRDESTFGPLLRIDHCTINNVGADKRNKTDASISLHGVQFAHIHNSIFNDSKPIRLHLVVGEPITDIAHCNFSDTPPIQANEDTYTTDALTAYPLALPDGADYTLPPSSPLRSASAQGDVLGYRPDHN